MSKNLEDTSFLVGVGDSLWPVTSTTPFEAIKLVKDRILKENSKPSLVELISGGKADFLVMDDSRRSFYASESQGTYTDCPSDEIIEKMARLLPPKKYRTRHSMPD